MENLALRRKNLAENKSGKTGEGFFWSELNVLL